MATYVVLCNFTDQGIRNVQDTVKRAEAFKVLAKANGATIKDIYWTLGQYDLVVTFEASDDATVVALGLSLGKAGNIRSQTLPAFDAAAMTKILAKVV